MMTSPSRLSALILALAAALPLGTVTMVTVAHAQTTATVSAQSFAVEAVRALTPGTELDFQLSATPGADVTLQMTGATGTLRMYEIRAGVYQGTYTVRSRDKLTATSLVTARIEKAGQVFNATLDQSLQRGAPSPVQAARIGAFTVNAPERIRGGRRAEVLAVRRARRHRAGGGARHRPAHRARRSQPGPLRRQLHRGAQGQAAR